MKAPKKFKRLIPNAKAFTSNNVDASERRKFYQSSSWRQVRQASKLNTIEQQLSDDKLQHYYAKKVLHQGSPLCVKCLTKPKFIKANTCDHIKPIALGGAKLQLSNLQWLCSSCHNSKSGKEAHQ
jgi:5-methylcytosine-specific restriction endonuclease McrA